MSYRVSVTNNRLNVSLSRTGGQGSKGDSISDIYLDGGDVIMEVSDAAGNLVDTYNLGSLESISTVDSINQITDVTATDPATGETLFYNVDHWENRSITTDDVSGLGTAATANLDDLGAVTVDSVTFSNTEDGAPQSQVTWNVDEETLDIIQNGTTLQVGQEVQYHVINGTTETINDGTLVMITGSEGNSGKLLVAPMIADGSIPARYVLGMATESIPANGHGKVTHFGKVRGINTSAWPEGSILYADPGVPGGFTTTTPEAPNLKLPIAFVINSHSNVGTLFIRVETGTDLHNNHQVEVSGLTEGDFLRWNDTLSRWENSQVDYAATNHDHDGVYEPVDSTILRDSDIGVSVQAYSTDFVIDPDYTHTDNNYTTAEKTKLAGVEVGADVTDASNVAAAGAVMAADTSTAGFAFVVDEDNLSSNSPTRVPTQQSVKAYVDNSIASSVHYEGGYNPVTQTPDLSTGVTKGAMYTITAAGTFLGISLEVGDVIIAEQDEPVNVFGWTFVQKNLDAASILTAVKTVDGPGSGLNADLLDGYNSSYFGTAADTALGVTAYGWGDHSTEGYLTTISAQSIEELSDVAAMTPTDGQALVWDSVGGAWTASDVASSYGDSEVDTHLNTGTAGSGQLLSWTGTDYDWIDSGGVGTVTSVGATVPTGFTVSGSPVTASGTLTIDYDTGYQGYTSTEATKLAGIEVGATADQTASEVSYDNTTSGLTATEVNSAIDEVEARVDSLETDSHTHSNKAILDATTASYTTEESTKLSGIETGATADQAASEVPYSNTTSGLTATTVQAAVDEVEGRLDAVEGYGDHSTAGYVTSTSSQALDATDAISVVGNVLYLNKADGTNETIDLSVYLDDTNLARIVSGTYVTDEPTAGDKNLKFVRDDASVFYIDASMFFDDTNLVTSVAGKTGAVTLVEADISDFGSYEPADATILRDSDIGVSVQGHSSVLDATTASYTTAEETKLAGIEAGATADQSASEVPYDNTVSGLTATNVKAALDEVTSQAVTTSDIGVSVQAYDANIVSDPNYSTNSTNWSTAYSWGDHSSVGYLTSITGESIKSLSDVASGMIPTDGQVLTYDSINGWSAEDAATQIDSIKDISDVNSVMTPADGEVLTYNSTQGYWESAAPTGGSGDLSVDGGSSASVYLATQSINGGGA